eukprot:6410149-Amphidinium_carterae.1
MWGRVGVRKSKRTLKTRLFREVGGVEGFSSRRGWSKNAVDRCGFDFAGSAVLGGAVYGLGRLMPKM